MQQQALSAIVAWVRLERATEAFHADLKKRFDGSKEGDWS